MVHIGLLHFVVATLWQESGEVHRHVRRESFAFGQVQALKVVSRALEETTSATHNLIPDA